MLQFKRRKIFQSDVLFGKSWKYFPGPLQSLLLVHCPPQPIRHPQALLAPNEPPTTVLLQPFLLHWTRTKIRLSFFSLRPHNRRTEGLLKVLPPLLPPFIPPYFSRKQDLGAQAIGYTRLFDTWRNFCLLRFFALLLLSLSFLLMTKGRRKAPPPLLLLVRLFPPLSLSFPG